MKIIISLIMALLLVSPVVFAQEVAAGITPDAGIFYNIDVWFDNARIRNAQSAIERARLRLEVASERLSEMKQMALQNKVQAMERARLEERNQINQLENDEAGLNENQKIEIQGKLQNHIDILTRVRDQVPEQAKDGLNNALKNANRVFEKNQERIQQRTQAQHQTNINQYNQYIVGG